MRNTIIMALLLGLSSSLFADDLVDYSTLDHTIGLEEFRAGNHSGPQNIKYYFTVSCMALEKSHAEQKLPPEERKRVIEKIGEFANLEIAPLSFWKPDEKTKALMKLPIAGEVLRKLVATMMTQHRLNETQVFVEVKIELYAKQAKFIFLNDDRFVASVSYFPIPYDNADIPLKTNQKLELKETGGAVAGLHVQYKDVKDTAKKTAAAQ